MVLLGAAVEWPGEERMERRSDADDASLHWRRKD
jgi:hypothetical protein